MIDGCDYKHIKCEWCMRQLYAECSISLSLCINFYVTRVPQVIDILPSWSQDRKKEEKTKTKNWKHQPHSYAHRKSMTRFRGVGAHVMSSAI